MGKTLRSSKSAPLAGVITVPGDKSLSHRALILASMAVGESRVSGLLEGEDVLCTLNAMRSMGADIVQDGDEWVVRGLGIGGLHPPQNIVDMGNSGTAVRLLMGVVASHPFTTMFAGDASLSKRPMQRVITPLSEMGAKFEAREGGRLPLTVVGSDELLPLEYDMPVASAQVKSAILLAGLNTGGTTIIHERIPTRDHTERMLRGMGADLECDSDKEGGVTIRLQGYPELKPITIAVPGDPSSAAFLVVAALLVPGSELTITNVGANPHRTGLYTTLQEMGADIEFSNAKEQAGEPVADIIVRASKLRGVQVPKERVASMIDEFPILAVAASCAEGDTIMEGLEELKVKESNRLQAIADGLEVSGVPITLGEASLVVHGSGGAGIPGGGTIATHLDHRIAMAFLVLGLCAVEPIVIDDASMIDTSFPEFGKLMQQIGANIYDG